MKRDIKIALPVDNPIIPRRDGLILRKEDVITLPLVYARILIKAGRAEEIPTNAYGLKKVEVRAHDMGKSESESMANVEG